MLRPAKPNPLVENNTVISLEWQIFIYEGNWMSKSYTFFNI